MSEDTELDGLIVRNIGDLEASIARAIELGNELEAKVVNALQRFADRQGWYFLPGTAGELGAKLGPREWLVKDDEADFWFCLGETSDTDEYDKSWIAEFVAAGPNGTSIVLLFDQKLLTEAKMRKLLESEASALQPLERAGFRQDGCYLTTPVTLSLESLASAFEQDDFDVVLAPLDKRLTNAASQIGEFEAVAARVRAKAQG